MVTTLALDLGSSLGYAVCKNGQIIDSGTKQLTVTGQPPGYRGVRFHNFLYELDEKYGITEIVFEEISHVSSKSAHAALVKGGLIMLTQMFAYSTKTILKSYHPSTLKKDFAGHGHAKKEDICAKLHDLGWQGGTRGKDHDNDEADACALLFVLYREEKRDICFTG